MPGAGKLYRLLLKLYPARFREEYGKPLERQFLDEYRDQHGGWQRLLFWTRTLTDLAWSIPTQFAREVRQDLRHSVRVYARRPFVTLLALSALTLGIGATTGVFSVVNAVLLRPLPFRDADRLVDLRFFPSSISSSAAFHRWRVTRPYLEDVAVFASGEMNLGYGSGADRVRVTTSSANFFSMFGAGMARGRGFAPGEDRPGRSPVAVISYGLWQQAVGGAPNAVGTTIRLDGRPVTIVGVASRGMEYPDRTAVWISSVAMITSAVGRLKPGVTLSQAEAAFEVEMARFGPFETTFSKRVRQAGAGWLVPLRDELVGPVRRAALILLGAVAFVLLIACANVAHLILMRANERRRELVIRATLGASRARIVQQLVTETVVLSVIAAVAGLVVAGWVSKLASVALPVRIRALDYTVFDPRVLGLAVGLSLFTGVLAGIVPALLVGRVHPTGDPLRVPAGGRGFGASRARRVLVALQISLTLVLVAGAIALGRSFVGLLATDIGLRTDHVITLSVSLRGSRYGSGPSTRQYFYDAVERLRSVPGVASAAAVEVLPLARQPVRGAQFRNDSGGIQPVGVVVVTPDYFRTMGIEILKGRALTDADRQRPDGVAVVDEEVAAAFGDPRLIVGKTLGLTWRDASFTVLGVSRAVRYAGPAYSPPMPLMFILPEHRRNMPEAMTLVARVSGDTRDRIAECRAAIQSLDRSVPVFGPFTLDERFAELLAQPRFYATAMLFFGIFALLLAVAATYGAASYGVAQRTHEIGVRLAVGSSVGGVRRLLLRQGLLPVVIGVVLGAAGAIAFGGLLKQLFVAAQPVEPRTCAVAALLLGATAVTAIWTATGRITRLDPLEVLRAE